MTTFEPSFPFECEELPATDEEGGPGDAVAQRPSQHRACLAAEPPANESPVGWANNAATLEPRGVPVVVTPTLDISCLDKDMAAALNLGVFELDSDHRTIVAHYQTLMRALNEDHGCTAFPIVFHGLLYATSHHFAHEEYLMQKADYPGYDLHRAAHAKLLRDGRDFLVNILTVYAREEYAAVAKFIKYWLLTHIETHDKKFAKFLTNQDKVIILGAV